MKFIARQHVPHYCAKIVIQALLVGLVFSQAAEDRFYDSQCSPFWHDCAHRKPFNPGMCKTGLQLCAGTQNPYTCEDSNISYYEVKQDFPQGTIENSTMTCVQQVGGTGQFQIWAEHTQVVSPAAQCYVLVRCRWDAQTRKCVRAEYISAWYYEPKLQAVPCPPPQPL